MIILIILIIILIIFFIILIIFIILLIILIILFLIILPFAYKHFSQIQRYEAVCATSIKPGISEKSILL